MIQFGKSIGFEKMFYFCRKGTLNSSLLSPIQWEHAINSSIDQIEIIDKRDLSKDLPMKNTDTVIRKSDDKRYSKRVKVTDTHVDANTLCIIDAYLPIGLSFDDAHFSDYMDIPEFLESIVSKIHGTQNVVQTLNVDKGKINAVKMPPNVIDSEIWTSFFKSVKIDLSVIQWMMELVKFVVIYINDTDMNIENKSSLVSFLVKVMSQLETLGSGFLHSFTLESSEIKVSMNGFNRHLSYK